MQLNELNQTVNVNAMLDLVVSKKMCAEEVLSMALRHMTPDGAVSLYYDLLDVDVDLDESMDGDADSALASAGWGTDEDYGGYDMEDY